MFPIQFIIIIFSLLSYFLHGDVVFSLACKNYSVWKDLYGMTIWWLSCRVNVKPDSCGCVAMMLDYRSNSPVCLPRVRRWILNQDWIVSRARALNTISPPQSLQGESYSNWSSCCRKAPALLGLWICYDELDMFSTSTAANSEGIQSNTSIREHHSVDYVLALDRWSRLGIRELGDLENKPRSTGVICERVGIKSKSKSQQM